MKINEGPADRIIRVLIGLFVLSLIWWGPKTLWGLVGLVPLITGITGFCGAYALFGASTAGKKKETPPPTQQSQQQQEQKPQ
jgi:uncharacterized RDD family membrane protein YckC